MANFGGQSLLHFLGEKMDLNEEQLDYDDEDDKK